MTCVLLSGGVDSAVLLTRLLKQGVAVPVYVRCGFVWEEAELHWLRRLLKHLACSRLKPLHVLSVPMQSLYGKHWSLTGRHVPGARSRDSAVFLPGRNAVLLSTAAIVAHRTGAGCLALGVLKGNPFGDATPRFFRKLSESLTEAFGRPFRIAAPLRHLTKTQLLKRNKTAPFALSFSCISPKLRYHHCGCCNKCAERKRAFRKTGIIDSTRYIGP